MNFMSACAAGVARQQKQEQAVKDDLPRYRVASHVYCHAFVHASAMLSAANALAGSGS
jgi:hypothetical protein